MHLNYYFLRKISSDLNVRIKGLKMASSFSQSKDELIMQFVSESGKLHFYLRALLSPSFTCLSFPETYQRSKRNSVDLFGKLLHQKVSSVVQFVNERAFSIEFENNYSLVFKLYGNRSNIILFKDGTFEDMFHKKMLYDSKLVLPLNRTFDVTFDKFTANPSLQNWFPVLRGLPEIYLKSNGYEEATIERQWNLIQTLVENLTQSEIFYILKYEDRYHLSLLPIGEIVNENYDILDVSNEFNRIFITDEAFNKESGRALSMLQNEILKSENYISKTTQKINSIKEDGNYQQFGDVIMANLNNIRPHESLVKLFNFYTDKEIEIKLKPLLNPQKNAENYYRKAKNQFLEIISLESTLNDRKERLQQMISASDQIKGSDSLKSLKQNIKKLNTDTKSQQKTEPKPYHERQFKGATILIGKNARSNDILLNTYSNKEDLWFHVRDAPGSHVIVKYKGGKTYTKEIIEKAAQLAAYYSKRKSETLVPVSYTQRKYVRKRKGDPPGMVVIEKEKVTLVRPATDPI